MRESVDPAAMHPPVWKKREFTSRKAIRGANRCYRALRKGGETRGRALKWWLAIARSPHLYRDDNA